MNTNKTSKRTWIKQCVAALAFVGLVKANAQESETKQEFSFSLKSYCTRDILIPLEDNGRIIYEANIYGEYVKYVATAYSQRPPFVSKRYESKLMLATEISTKSWSEFEQACKADFAKVGPTLKPCYTLQKTYQV